MARVFAVLFLAAMLVACGGESSSSLEGPRLFFEKNKTGTSPDYGVIKWSNPDDHVITIHGFADDQASCQEVADALNLNACKELDGQNCLDPYSCVRLNQ